MNDFSKFVETYKEDIKAFFEALIEAIKAIIAKFNEGDASSE